MTCVYLTPDDLLPHEPASQWWGSRQRPLELGREPYGREPGMEVEATANPTFEAEPAPTLDIEAAVRDGELTVEQAVVELQRQMSRRVAALEARLGPAGELDSAIRSVVAHLAEAPMVRHGPPSRRRAALPMASPWEEIKPWGKPRQ